MKSTTPALVFGSALAASVLTVILSVVALREVWAGDGSDPGLRVELAALGDRVEALAELLERDGPTPPGEPALELDPGLHDTLGELGERVARIEAAARREPAALPAAGEPGSVPGTADRDPLAGRPAKPKLGRDEFAALLGRVLFSANDVSPEEQARFWETARSTGYVDELLEELGASVADRPSDVGLRLELADAYVAKLLTVPAGPERGVWGMKAEEQWNASLALDPRSWDAQFRLAESLSYYPEFLNKAGEAIAGLERARELQEELVAELRHAQTYLLLSRLYARQSRPDDALAVLRDGLARHPGNAELAQALADLERR